MHSVGVLILFCVLGVVICAKARVPGGAAVFALIGTVLFVSTPAGHALPQAISGLVSTFDDASTPALTHETAHETATSASATRAPGPVG
jgi:hypothetical protein